MALYEEQSMNAHNHQQTVSACLRATRCRLLFLFVLITFTTGILAATADNATSPDTIAFGVVPQQSASKLARLWSPFFEHLSTVTGYRIEFKTAPDIPEFERRLANGEYDMAYMNPYHYTVFHEHPGYQAFAREKDKLLKGILVVRTDSTYKDLEELSGKTLAFPSPAAFAASMITRASLQNRSIPFEAKYVSSHDSVYRSVAKGLYPAGGGVIRTFNNLEDDIRKQLRILWISPGYTPHAFAAHPRLESAVVTAIQTAMVQLDQTAEGRALLENLELNGITQASDEEWNDIRSLQLQSPDNLTPAASRQ